MCLQMIVLSLVPLVSLIIFELGKQLHIFFTIIISDMLSGCPLGNFELVSGFHILVSLNRVMNQLFWPLPLLECWAWVLKNYFQSVI